MPTRHVIWNVRAVYNFNIYFTAIDRVNTQLRLHIIITEHIVCCL